HRGGRPRGADHGQRPGAAPRWWVQWRIVLGWILIRQLILRGLIGRWLGGCAPCAVAPTLCAVSQRPGAGPCAVGWGPGEWIERRRSDIGGCSFARQPGHPRHRCAARQRGAGTAAAHRFPGLLGPLLVPVQLLGLRLLRLLRLQSVALWLRPVGIAPLRLVRPVLVWPVVDRLWDDLLAFGWRRQL